MIGWAIFSTLIWAVASGRRGPDRRDHEPHSSDHFGAVSSPCKRWVNRMRREFPSEPGFDVDEIERIYADTTSPDVQDECALMNAYLDEGYSPFEAQEIMDLELRGSRRKRRV